MTVINTLPGVPTPLAHQMNIDMRYQPTSNNRYLGKIRLNCTMMYVARFGLTCPTFICELYNIRKTQALEHLNRLVKLKLLDKVISHRSVDHRVYVLTHSGAKHAEQLLQQQVHFRSSPQPAKQVNLNTLMHDLICQFVMATGIQNTNKDGAYAPLWTGFVTEKEFRRLYPQSAIRNVDGLVKLTDNSICAVDIEHSFKSVATRRTILLKYLSALKEGLYEKVFLFSQSEDILTDTRRINTQLLSSLSTTRKKKSGEFVITNEDKAMLEEKLIYRTKYCAQIESIFYE